MTARGELQWGRVYTFNNWHGLFPASPLFGSTIGGRTAGTDEPGALGSEPPHVGSTRWARIRPRAGRVATRVWEALQRPLRAERGALRVSERTDGGTGGRCPPESSRAWNTFAPRKREDHGSRIGQGARHAGTGRGGSTCGTRRCATGATRSAGRLPSTAGTLADGTGGPEPGAQGETRGSGRVTWM